MKNIKIKFTNERIIPTLGLAVVGTSGQEQFCVKHCNRMDVTKNRLQYWIKNGNILLIYIRSDWKPVTYKTQTGERENYHRPYRI